MTTQIDEREGNGFKDLTDFWFGEFNKVVTLTGVDQRNAAIAMLTVAAAKLQALHGGSQAVIDLSVVAGFLQQHDIHLTGGGLN